MKYGKYEYERTFLLENNCLRDKKIEQVKKIKDKYINGTRLRLREVIGNNEIKFKLTKKEESEEVKQGVLRINTLSLTKNEYFRIKILDGIEIEKKRHIIRIEQIRIGIDKIVLNQKSIFIAEVEFETELEMNTFTMPLQNIREITGEEKYSGYEIAKRYSENKLN